MAGHELARLDAIVEVGLWYGPVRLVGKLVSISNGQGINMRGRLRVFANLLEKNSAGSWNHTKVKLVELHTWCGPMDSSVVALLESQLVPSILHVVMGN